jgi:tetratricopeptide (TPR) repeat protein
MGETPSEGRTKALFAKGALWLGNAALARSLADQAWELAFIQDNEGDFIRAARQQGAAALGLDDLVVADDRLNHALVRARTAKLIEEEIPALVGLAELERRQGNLETAREFLEDAWELAEPGPYPIFHADAYNVLTQIERDAGNQTAATAAATKAYHLAWCDGPPFAYQHGLVQAQVHLNALGEPMPIDLPVYDEAAHEPTPEIEINPLDKFAGNV